MRIPQDVYADLSGNVLLHASVPALGLHAVQWAIISWGHTHAQLPDFADSRFTYRFGFSRVACLESEPVCKAFRCSRNRRGDIESDSPGVLGAAAVICLHKPDAKCEPAGRTAAATNYGSTGRPSSCSRRRWCGAYIPQAGEGAEAEVGREQAADVAAGQAARFVHARAEVGGEVGAEPSPRRRCPSAAHVSIWHKPVKLFVAKTCSS